MTWRRIAYLTLRTVVISFVAGEAFKSELDSLAFKNV